MNLSLRDAAFLGTQSNWAQRVVNNGGAMPSLTTINAMETFRQELTTNGLMTKMHSVCVFVPDSLIAALTPIVVGIGADPWINTNFVTADLNSEGLKGNGSTKYLDTGVIGNSGNAYNSITGNCGMSVLITEQEGNPTGRFDVGHRDSGNRALILGASVTLNSTNGRTGFFCRTSGVVAEIAFTTDWNRCGFVSGNNVSGTSSIYVKSPLTPLSLLATAVVTPLPSTSAIQTIFAFAFNDNGVAVSHCAKRMSTIAIHDGLTSAESEKLGDLLMTLRTSLGGGTGDEVENWAMRVVSLGGVAPSTSTKSALRTFYSGLGSANILSKMVAVNALPPDNLTAASMPLIWRAGNELWTNNNFLAGDLTVDGLIGDGSSKYLNTGIITSAVTGQSPNVTGFSDTSAGISVLMFSNPGTITAGFFRVAGAVAFSQFGDQLSDTGNYSFFCWRASGASGSNFLSPLALPSSTWIGYLGSNRTASNAIAVYRASSTLAHATLGSGAVAQTGTAFGAQPIFAFAVNSNGPAILFANQRLSFLALHAGLSSAESALFYDLIAALRIALGGGNP